MKGLDLSGIRKMFELAGKDAISFGIGEPDLDPPARAIAAYEQALRSGQNKYCPSAGIEELRVALAAQARTYWPEAQARHVVVTAGSLNGLLSTMLCFLNPGDEILVPDPGFVAYDAHPRIAGARPVPYPVRAETAFCPRPEDIAERITPKTKAIVVNSPSNPTGGVLTEAAADGIAEVAEDKGLLVISDEAYDRFSYDAPHVSMLGRAKDLIYLNTFSKTYAMTGWRLGWIVASGTHAEVLRRMNYQMVASPPTPTQYAALAALEGPQDDVARMVAMFKQRRDLMVRRLQGLPHVRVVPPRGAFYVFPRLDLPGGDEAIAHEILKRGLVTIPGSSFGPGGAGHLRLSYALPSERITQGMDILEQFLRDH